MNNYKFNLVNGRIKGQLEDKSILKQRPESGIGSSFAKDARRFVTDEELDTAINTAIAVAEPLLITGEPGTGKTQTAYYAAYKLDIEPVLHFQVKSDTTAKDLMYHFDTVRYFHEANIRKDVTQLDKSKYIYKKELWLALETDEPRVLLIDEIDKAPRDFPNDLLHELDQMEFEVPEIDTAVKGKPANRPIVFITSNSERRLPEPFLRRCVYHHIEFDRELVRKAVFRRQDEYPELNKKFLEMAIDRFLALRETVLRKYPATAELLGWLRVLGLNANQYTQGLDDDLSELPYLGALIKDHQDREDLKGRQY